MSASTSTVATCSNPACRVADNNKCIEGLALEKCPRYGRAPEPVPSEEPAATVVEAEAGIALASGDRLDVAEAVEVLAARVTRVVAMLGARDAGKTSLIASLFGLFQDGEVGEWAFAGSRTLVAFEHACHDIRAKSGRTTPKTERTARGPVGFYEIRLSAADRTQESLLVADRAGEEYLELGDDATGARRLPELLRADVLTLLVDGARLVDVTRRHNLKSELLIMLQAIHDGDALTGQQCLAIALTKLDELHASSGRERAEKDFADLVAKITQLFGPSFAKIEPFMLAASPVHGGLQRGHGVADLLAFWLSRSEPASIQLPAAPAAERAFARLQAPED